MEVSSMGVLRHWTCGLGHSFASDPGEDCPHTDTGGLCGAPVFEWVDAATYRGAVDESRMLRRIVQATQEYLLLAPDDSVDYDALLTRVRSALGGR